jgi:hypothetical protein
MSALLVGMLPQRGEHRTADDRPRHPDAHHEPQQTPRHKNENERSGRGKVTKHAPTVSTGNEEHMTRKRATYQPTSVQNAPMRTQVAVSVALVAIAALMSTLITLTIGLAR